MSTAGKPYFIILSCGLLFAYIATRCVMVDITHDEAYSFRVMKHFWYAEALCTANTHWLNSLAMKAAIISGWERNWQLRWFSMLSALLFLFAGGRWIMSIKGVHLKIFAFVLLLLNPYLTDYMGLARGYASGIMLETAALLLLFNSLNQMQDKMGRLGLLCAALSCIANYSFVYFFAGYAAVYFWQAYFKNGKPGWRKGWFYVDILISFGVLIFIFRALVFITRCSNDIVGAGTGSITEVARAFTGSLIYRYADMPTYCLVAVTIVLGAGVLIICATGLGTRAKDGNSEYFCSSRILLITLLLIIGSHILPGAVYPYARSALFLFPLLCMNTVYFAARMKINKYLLTLASLMLAINFVSAFNLSHTLDYKAQEDTKEAFDRIDAMQIKSVFLGRGTYGVYTNYYEQTGKLKYSFHGLYADSLLCGQATAYALLTEANAFRIPPCYRSDTLYRSRSGNLTLVRLQKID